MTINATDALGRTALLWAAWTADLDAVRTLLEHGADPNLKDEACGESPLYEACYDDSVELIETLLQHGADPIATNKDGSTALHVRACLSDFSGPVDCSLANTHVLNTLLDAGVPIDACDRLGHTALMEAIRCNSHSAIKILLKRGAGYTAKTNHGYTILHIVATWADATTMRILTAHGLPGIDFDKKAKRTGMTALEQFEGVKSEMVAEEIEAFYHLWRKVSTPGSLREECRMAPATGFLAMEEPDDEGSSDDDGSDEIFFDAVGF
ncbi:hypothetical protein SLS56_000795 [Neofusicoccum ribis]|uniref:Ankyrin n=1 Tax=Neofusicoccum ribis TaxID=45134 RepID=A0ABR3TCC9_9PEZI